MVDEQVSHQQREQEGAQTYAGQATVLYMHVLPKHKPLGRWKLLMWLIALWQVLPPALLWLFAVGSSEVPLTANLSTWHRLAVECHESNLLLTCWWLSGLLGAFGSWLMFCGRRHGRRVFGTYLVLTFILLALDSGFYLVLVYSPPVTMTLGPVARTYCSYLLTMDWVWERIFLAGPPVLGLLCIAWPRPVRRHMAILAEPRVTT